MGEDPSALRTRDEAGAPTREEVQIQLARILASKGFSRSQRLRRFLNYVIQERLRGND